MHTPRTRIRRLVVGLALGSLLALGLGVAPSAQAADACVFQGSGTVSPGVKTQAEFHNYSFSGTLTCSSGTKAISGSGSGTFGCFEPGTSTATISGGVSGSISFQHAGVSMTSTGASGGIAGAQLLFYVTDPVQGGYCASTGLGGAQLGGIVALS